MPLSPEVQAAIDRNRRRPHWDAPKQELGEFEVEREPCLNGRRHLHYLFTKGKWEWVLRQGRFSSLCGTTRCRVVEIIELVEGMQ